MECGRRGERRCLRTVRRPLSRRVVGRRVAQRGSMSDELTGTAKRDYVPAAPQLWLYDFLVAALARESRWRPALLRQINPTAEDSIADIGCGTGTLLALIGQTARPAVLIGIDPDRAILERARR